jgi:hypothetical protein
MLAGLKAFLTFLGALFRFLGDKQLMDAGKAEQRLDDVVKANETVDRVNAPISDDERRRVWERLQALRHGKYL